MPPDMSLLVRCSIPDGIQVMNSLSIDKRYRPRPLIYDIHSHQDITSSYVRLYIYTVHISNAE